MNIAYISADFGIPVHGHKGASIHVRELSSALAALGHRVEILTCRAGGDAPSGFDVPVHEFPVCKPERLLVGSLQDDPHASEPMAREVRSMLYASTLRYEALPVLREMRAGAIYERYSLLGAAGIELARALRIPHILEVNAPLSEEHARHRSAALGQTIRAVEQQVLGASDQVIAVSEPLKQWVVDTGVDPNRVTVASNGVDVERFAMAGGDVRQRLGIDDRPVVGFVGTLKAWHGTATLIRAMGILARKRGADRSLYLLIVGDGPERDRLEQLVADESLTSMIRFTGMIAHDQMPAYIAAMDIAVAPYDQTPDFYFSPLKLFEYMAAGKPIVAAGIGQIAECIQDGETGLLYPPGDDAALTRAIEQLLADRRQAMALGRSAQEAARMSHSWRHNARIVTDLIEAERSSATPLLSSSERHEGSG